MTRIETTMTVSKNGTTAHIDLPVPVAPGRHPAVIIIDDADAAGDAAEWAARTYGALTDDDFERPSPLSFEERRSFE